MAPLRMNGRRIHALNFQKMGRVNESLVIEDVREELLPTLHEKAIDELVEHVTALKNKAS